MSFLLFVCLFFCQCSVFPPSKRTLEVDLVTPGAASHMRLQVCGPLTAEFGPKTGPKTTSCLCGNNAGPSLSCALFLLLVVASSTHQNATKKSAPNAKREEVRNGGYLFIYFYAASFCFRTCLCGTVTRISC